MVVAAAIMLHKNNVRTFLSCLGRFFNPCRTAPEVSLQNKVDTMAKKMFVGNLSFQTTESDVRAAFEQYGAVESVAIITDRDTGRSKGFGFVEMSDDNAEKAIAQFNGTELNGRALTVNEARPLVAKDFAGRSAGSRGARRSGRY